MERLTKTVNGVVTYIGTGNEFDTGALPAELSSGQIRAVMNRLAAYEDTGLEPEQVMELKSFTQGGIHKVDDGWKHVQDLLQAEKEGRMVLLPSKTVWELTMDAGPDCDMKCPVDIFDEALGCDFCSRAKQFAYERPCTQERLKGLGKTVFLTREEAEDAMKEATHA